MKEFFRTLPWRLKRWLSQITFYKKKAFAVTLTVIFSVLLVMTIAIRVFVRDTGSMMSSRGTAGFDISDVDSSELEEMFGEMPDGMGDGADGSLNADSDGSRDDSTSDDGDKAGNATNDGNDASSNSDSGDMSGMPSGGMGDFSGDSDSMPSGDFSEDADGMPSGDFSGGMGDFSGNSDDSSEESGDSDSSSDGALTGDGTTAAAGATGIIGFLQGWRAHWLVFLVIFAIADILCIVRLAILARRKKKQQAEEAAQAREQMLAGEIVHTARPVKKHKVNSAAVWAIPMVGVLLLAAIVNAMSAQTSVSAAQTEATVYSGTAEVTSMDTVLPGAGTLEEEDAVTIELLSDVEISKWYVSDGDTVAEGDTLALVDSVSVMSAIASLQEQLDALDEELAECEDEEISETITAAADGRVMAIYAEENTAVTDTMYAYSALMLISLDGYLCVSMESDADILAGDTVVVTLSDDSTVDGKVGSVLSGTITILVADEDASLGESVSVETEDGEEIGEGTLLIHSQLSVTGYAGTVSEIEVEVGDEVESGDTLLTLTDTEYTGTYEQLLTQRGELEEAMQELFVLYQDPYLYATASGVVSGTGNSSSSDENSDDSSSSDSDDADSSDSDGTDSEDSDELASVTVKENVISISTSSASGDTESADGNTASAASTEEISADTSSKGSLDGESTSDTDISSYTNLIGVVSSVSDGVATIIYLPDTCTISDYTDLGGIDLDTDLMTQTGTLTTSTGYLMFTYTGSSFSIGTAADLAAGDTIVLAYNSDGNLVWIVRVDVTEDDSDSDSSGSGSGTDGGSSSGSSFGSDSGSSSGSNSGSSASTGDSMDSSSGNNSSSSGNSGGDSSSSSSNNSSDSIWGSISDYGSTDSSTNSSGSTYSDSATGSSSDLSTLTSAVSGSSDSSSADGTDSDSSSLGGSTSDSSVSGDSSNNYSVSRTTAVSITPQDTMSLTITVDELDILSLEVGQTAQVTLDAFPGQSFEGEVTSIDLTGTNSGGSTKFTAVVTIDREEDMLVGMNASANIVIDTADEVLCIPEAALVEEEASVYVYTTYDEETDTLGGLVEVTTGISDGENVEILSGLTEGDTYYYSYLDVVNYSTSSSSSGSSSFSIDSLFSSGGGGGGMSMP